MCKLEYLITGAQLDDISKHQRFLNKVGRAGWQLCCIMGTTHYFCREVQPQAIQLEQEAGDSAFVNKKCGSQLYW